MTAASPWQAYALPACHAEADTVDRCGTHMLAKLKHALHGALYEKQAWKMEITRAVRELQTWRRLSSL